ncbi:HNH endonuclease [Bacillus cereus]|uniref:HNH endonuclease n=1 Tax=Bacillus cereus TaxID=1396 RepID=UPI003EE3A889
MHVILQPRGKDETNYNRTMRKGVYLSEIQSFFTVKEFEELSQAYGNRKVYIWGIKHGNTGRNSTFWQRIERGDIALFYNELQFFSSATVTYKVHNSQLARHLWGETTGGIYEYLYFLDEIKYQQIPVSIINNLLKYKSKEQHLPGVRVLSEEKSSILINTFDFYSSTHLPVITKEEVQESLQITINELEQNASLEREVKGRARKEQNKIRGYLFGNQRICNCGICGEEYPVDLLVAAHIKKRAHCTKIEKIDIEYIAMPMCKFGCDDLFEKGYISVRKGKVISLVDTEYLPKTVKDYIENIEGKVCDNWNERNDKYFEWHVRHHMKTL